MKNWDVKARVMLEQNCIVRAATAEEAIKKYAAGDIEWGGDYGDPISEDVLEVTESEFQEARVSMVEAFAHIRLPKGDA
jgi:hypothetical protein